MLYKYHLSLSWIKLIKSHGLEILKIQANTIFPSFYEIPKIGLTIKFDEMRIVKIIVDALRPIFPFKYIGHSMVILM